METTTRLDAMKKVLEMAANDYINGVPLYGKKNSGAALSSLFCLPNGNKNYDQKLLRAVYTSAFTATAYDDRLE